MQFRKVRIAEFGTYFGTRTSGHTLQARAQRSGDILGRRPSAEADDPGGKLRIVGDQHIAVELEEGDQRDKGFPLVPVDEGLGLGDAVRKDGGLQGEVGLLVVRVSGWTAPGLPRELRGSGDGRQPARSSD